MKIGTFLLQSILNPRKVGAVFPSSVYLAEKMMSAVQFQQAKYVVEYGPGTGVFTDKILTYRKPDTLVLLIEHNKEFYKQLKEKYKAEKNLIIVNDTAEQIDWYTKRYGIPAIDYVISGLPFASLPKHVSHNILDKTKKLLSSDGEFITFQYSLCRKEFISQFFSHIDVKLEYRNVPPAFIFNCNNQQLLIRNQERM
ncbi:class I SAM-dependent methyltransferase [Pseudobacillus wudalianchiensis]|uniref:SAM-dependent methyltransferase n=1 Tax=Pseudobacillus wudalianchiensis TaxID=1743143 RepID=A0A1B9AFZ6_9BACI|nr:rRNA adenine N-6-methyltransferase family protein [Bacillus wudalianchiensis]OCA82759.1 SAM-dependent methyltransferase [Bacillus wudalianchiensis]